MTDSISNRNRIFVGALKEAAITAAIATALMVPLIGLHAKTQATGLVIDTRFVEVAIAVGFIFIGRYLLVLTELDQLGAASSQPGGAGRWALDWSNGRQVHPRALPLRLGLSPRERLRGGEAR